MLQQNKQQMTGLADLGGGCNEEDALPSSEFHMGTIEYASTVKNTIYRQVLTMIILVPDRENQNQKTDLKKLLWINITSIQGEIVLVFEVNLTSFILYQWQRDRYLPNLGLTRENENA